MRELRQKHLLSQEQLAAASGLDRTYVSSLERERYAATVDTLEKLARALDVRPEDLLKAGGSRKSS